MAPDSERNLRLEIGHVLFLDLVGYSTLLIDEQKERMRQLTDIVLATSQVAKSTNEQLVRLPTGDGMALVFHNNSEEPVQCAIEVARALKQHTEIAVRMGIHSGPVSEVTDVSGRANIAGAGINVAQRVMDCGDAGHILLSKRVAEDLEQYGQWKSQLHDLGECEVKHGVRLGVVNLCGHGVGNPQLPKKFQALKKRRTRVLWGTAAGAFLALGAIVAGILIFSTQSIRAAPAKSIAVLPFENLSDEKQNSYLATGLVDEILTDLTKVADLKVICRTSAMQYAAGGSRDVRKIGAELDVAYILMGSVQRAGPQLRVHAQLVDAATGTQVWAEGYDRGITDIFAVESELAQAMVAQLHAKLSPGEKAAITNKPTPDLDAFELYTQARDLLTTSAIAQGEEKRLQAIGLLDEATKRDPNFLRAYCALVRVHSELYLLGMDHTSARLRLAETALQNAQRLQPDAGETHLAAAFLRYCQLDYDDARRELALAQRALPNESFVYELAGYMDRRQGRWEESERNLRHALELDPRNFYFLQQLSFSYEKLRRFDDMRILMGRALAVAPDDPGARINLAQADLFARADTKPERAALDAMVRENPKISQDLAVESIQLALYERDFAAADRALAGMAETGGLEGAFSFPRAWYAGLIAQAKGDGAAAHEAFTTAREEVARTLSERGEFPQPLSVLAMIDAALGNKDEAVAEGRRASQLLPVAQDAITGADILMHLAVTYAWCGEKDQALEQLSILSKIPSEVNYGILRLDPVWDSLRGDPRFEKIVADLAPKDPK